MNFKDIKNNFKSELSLVDKFIRENLKSNIDLINDISTYVISFSGKRIRSLIAILFGKILDYEGYRNTLISSVMELIHTATLLHDDVVDLSQKRRNKLTVNKIWGNKEAILCGDFLYTRSFQMMVSINNIDILKFMANTTNIMAEGEVNQLLHKNNVDITKKDYFNIIKAKTAQLFSASASVNAILSKSDPFFFKAFFNYGLNFGIAYQLVDDMLDYSSNDYRFGKNIGDDIFNGTFTLPLIYIMSHDAKKKKIIKDIISMGYNKHNFLKIKNIVLSSNALDYTLKIAIKHANLAKEALSGIKKSQYTQMASYLVDFIINRKY